METNARYLRQQEDEQIAALYANTVNWPTLLLHGISGHFLLTYLLLEALMASAPSRVVTVSSEGHKYGELDLDDVQLKRRWTALRAYCRSKTANVLFSTHLARLLQGLCSPLLSSVVLSDVLL